MLVSSTCTTGVARQVSCQVVATCPPLWVSPSLGLDSPYLCTLKLGHLVEPSMALSQSFLSIRVHALCGGPAVSWVRESL